MVVFIQDKEIKYKQKCDELNLNYIGFYYKGHDNHIQYTCNKHINKGILHSSWSHLKTAKFGCKYCSGKNRTTDDFKNDLINQPYEIMSEYLGSEKPITCKCRQCGHIWTTIARALYQGTKCPKCSIKERGVKSRMSHEEFLSRINPDIEILSQYQGLKIPVQCHCKKCGYEWQSKPDNLIHEHINCPACSRSKQEIKLGEVLEKLNLGTVVPHVRYKDCKYSQHNTLEFDFVIYNYNTKEIKFACEYDGEQHYIPIDFAGRGEDYAKESLHLTQERDKAKNQYCKEHNIPLIRIPYWEKNNMEYFLLSKYKEIYEESLETAG